MENITKEKIISLIKEYAKDQSAIGDYKIDNEKYGFLSSSFKFNLNSFSTESLLIYYIYKNKFINNSSFYSFDKIDDTNLNKNKDVYYLRVKFDKLPDITIKNTCRTTSGTNKKIKGRFLKLIPVDITFDEVKEIFNFIVEENRKFEAKTADIEISKRFEKYNIK